MLRTDAKQILHPQKQIDLKAAAKRVPRQFHALYGFQKDLLTFWNVLYIWYKVHRQKLGKLLQLLH